MRAANNHSYAVDVAEKFQKRLST